MRTSVLPRLLAVFLGLAAGSFPAARAQDGVPSAEGSDRGIEVGVETAPVVVDGVELFSLRGVSAFPAARRAAAVADRIRDLAGDSAFDPAGIELAHGDRDTRLVAGERLVLRLFDADAELEGIDRRVLAEMCEHRIRESILRYRAARTREALVSAAARSGVATVVAALVLFVFLRLARALRRWLERRYQDRVRAVTISSFEVVRVERLWESSAGRCGCSAASPCSPSSISTFTTCWGSFPGPAAPRPSSTTG